MKRGAAGALRRVREVEEVTRGEAERVAPAALGGEVAQRREALLDVIETERQRMPGVTELGAAAHGWPGHRAGRATDPDRRVRPLRGTGGERGAGEARVRALVLRNIAGPGRLDRAEIVVAQAPALPEWQAEVYELGLVPAHADAEDEAPARRLVDGGCRLGGHEGVPVGKHDDAGAEVDALRAPGEVREERKRVWPVAAIVLGGGGLGEDMIRDEDAVETQLLRARRQRLCLGDRELPDRKHDPIVHEPLLAKHPTVFGPVPYGARPPCFLSSGQEFCVGEYVSREEINDGTGTSTLGVEDEYRGTLSSTRVTHVSGLFCYLRPRPLTHFRWSS